MSGDSSRGRDKLPKPTSVVLLGKGELAIRALWYLLDDVEMRERYRIIAVVPVLPEPTWTDSLLSATQDARHLSAGSFTVHSAHEEAPEADLALSIFYDRILPADWIARYGRVLNLHNAPLPRYRGVNPINWALKNG